MLVETGETGSWGPENSSYTAGRKATAFMQTFASFVFAALCEIAGCYAAWMWLRLGKSPLWLVAGVVPLVLFAVALTKVETSHAGRAYAAYGGIYIVSSVLWLWAVEGVRPNKFDVLGSAICIAGVAVILLGARGKV